MATESRDPIADVGQAEMIARSGAQITKIGTWSFDYSTSSLSWSDGTHEIFGTTPTTFGGSPKEFLSHVHPEDRELVERSIKRARPDDSRIETEYRVVRASDGAERVVIEHGEAFFDDDGERVKNVGVVMDITERRVAQRGLQRSEALHKLVERLARIGGWSIDVGNSTINWSDEVCAIHEAPLGTSPSPEVVTEFFAPEHREMAIEAITQCAEQGLDFDLELQIETAKGNRKWVRLIGEAHRDSKGQIVEVQGAFQDLTREKQDELSIARSLLQLNEFADSMPFIVWTARPDGMVDFTNKAMIEYSGATELTTPDQLWVAGIYPEDLSGCIEAWEKAATTGKPYLHQFRILRHDGEYRWHQVGAKPSRDENGDIVKWYGTAIDIHDRINMEAEQRRLAERLTSTLESITDCFYILDHDWKFIYVNSEAERLLEFPRSKLIGNSIWETHPQAKETAIYSEFELVRSNRTTSRFEIFYEPFHRWFRVTVYPSSDGLTVHFRDITERHKSEERQQLMEAAMSRMNDLVIITEADPIDGPGPRITYVNESFERISGYSREEVLGKSPRFLQGSGTQRAELDRIRQALAERKSVRAKLLNYTKSGEELWLELEVVPITSMGRGLTHFVAVERNVTEQVRQESQLRQSEERFRIVTQATTDAIWDWDLENDVIWFSDSLKSIFGLDPASLSTGQDRLSYIHPEDRERVADSVREFSLSETDSWTEEYRLRLPDSSYAEVKDTGFFIRDGAGKPIRMVGGITNITEDNLREAQLERAQRLESVGQLTGGVAHDFNNLLTVILGNAEILAEDLEGHTVLGPLAQMIYTAAEQGAQLTRSLLAFARKQVLEPSLIDVDAVVRDMEPFLRRTIQEDIELTIKPSSGVWQTFADASQLESAILNLVINARDAMPDGGRLTLETQNVELDETYTNIHEDLKPGSYVMLAVSDTGTGMPPEVIKRIFEPFFTTKDFGQGSGLGMSMIFGYMKQSGGHAKVYSEEGVGTTVKLYLPRSYAEGQTAEANSSNNDWLGSGEHILVVEDEPLVQKYVANQLISLGYKVSLAANGVEALRLLKEVNTFDLLFTDVIMPGGINGMKLAEECKTIRPYLPVLFTSGYTENTIVHSGRLDPGVKLLSKPYGRRELARMVREALGGREQT